VVRDVEPLPRGNAENGQILYVSACSYCHGSVHSGAGRLSDRVPVLPEQTIDEHFNYTARELRLVFIEKVRHGLFLGYGGDMPPFSAETLSNAQLSDVLEALQVFGE
jgi:thiosulfate dehydrogenase